MSLPQQIPVWSTSASSATPDLSSSASRYEITAPVQKICFTRSGFCPHAPEYQTVQIAPGVVPGLLRISVPLFVQ